MRRNSGRILGLEVCKGSGFRPLLDKHPGIGRIDHMNKNGFDEEGAAKKIVNLGI
jgi:hypothetical protein